MLTSDLVVVVLVYAQPPLLGLILMFAVWARLTDSAWLAQSLGVRQRLRSTRFFECAAYSRLVGWLRYGTQGLALCAVFLIYDVDLVFFFAEATMFEQWTWAQVLLCGMYGGFFLCGVIYDVWRYGFMWA